MTRQFGCLDTKFGDIMKYDTDIFSNQYSIAASFVQHLAYYRVGKLVYDRLALKSPFWCATLDAHLKVAATQWCKVFGADGCNATHWKKTATLDVEEAKTSFRLRLQSDGLKWPDWEKYHRSMLAFRNKYVAHTEIGFSDPVPNFDTALKVVYTYDEWVRDLIKPHLFLEFCLSQHFEDWKRAAEPLIEAAILATAGMTE